MQFSLNSALTRINYFQSGTKSRLLLSLLKEVKLYVYITESLTSRSEMDDHDEVQEKMS